MLPAGARSPAAEGQERRLDRVVRGSVASRRQLNGYVEDIRRIPCLDVVQGQRAGAVPIACDFELHYRETRPRSFPWGRPPRSPPSWGCRYRITSRRCLDHASFPWLL